MAKHLAVLDPEARMDRLIEELTGPEQVFGLHRSDMVSVEWSLTLRRIQDVINEAAKAFAEFGIPVRWAGDRS